MAVTGSAGLSPRSVVGLFSVATASGVVRVADFVPVPTLVHPTSEAIWDARELQLDWDPGGATPDFAVVEIQSGGGLVNWVIALPADTRTISLPRIWRIDEGFGILPGPVNIVIRLVQISEFDYAALRYRHLVKRGWESYASDTFTTRYSPDAQ